MWRFATATGAISKSYRDMMARDYGEELEFLSTEQTREKLNSVRYFESISNPSAFHFHPLKYCLMLARTAEESWRQPA